MEEQGGETEEEIEERYEEYADFGYGADDEAEENENFMTAELKLMVASLPADEQKELREWMFLSLKAEKQKEYREWIDSIGAE